MRLNTTDKLKMILERSAQQFEDKLYIKHAPITHQEGDYFSFHIGNVLMSNSHDPSNVNSKCLHAALKPKILLDLCSI
jgi:hypothetical protein